MAGIAGATAIVVGTVAVTGQRDDTPATVEDGTHFAALAEIRGEIPVAVVAAAGHTWSLGCELDYAGTPAAAAERTTPAVAVAAAAALLVEPEPEPAGNTASVATP